MDRYIDVMGEGQFIETAVRFIAEVEFQVRAAKDETALREVAELVAAGGAALRASGISDDEIVEGGGNFSRPWYGKKQVGQESSRKVILKVADFGRLNRALEQLEPLQSRDKERKKISIAMTQPEFEESGKGMLAALAQAYEDARSKAEHLAIAMNCRLGDPIRLEEGARSKRNSGFSGDGDWGDSSRFLMGGIVLAAAGGAAASENESDLPSPTRTIFVTCRVRFAIAGKSGATSTST